MSRSYHGILLILLTTLLTGFSTSECQGQAPEPLYTLRAEAVEVEALGQVEMRIFLDVHTPDDPPIPESRVAVVQFGLSYQAQLQLICVEKGTAFGVNPGVFIMNSQDEMDLTCSLQDFDSNPSTPAPSPGESDAIFALQAWDGMSSPPVYFSGLDNELAVLTFESTGKAGAFPILFVGDLAVGSLGPFLVTITDEAAVDHSVDSPIGDPDVVTEDGQVLVRPTPVTDFSCNVTDECFCEVMMSWVNGETYNTLKLYETNTDPGNLVQEITDPTSTTATTVQFDPMTTYLLVGTSNGVGSIAATCTIVSSCIFPDVESPVIVDTPQDIEAFASGIACEAIVTWTDPTVTDNCPGATVECVPASGSIFVLGVHTVTCTATDASGYTSVETFDVTVKDVGLPTVTAPAPVLAECTGTAGQVIVIGTATATDICDTAPVITNDAPTLFSLGATTVTWTATDASGNFATATQIVTVVDTTAPTVTAPAPVLAECTGTAGQVIVIGTATATDICDTAPVITNDAPTLFSLGATTVTWTATDASGNFATATQIVTVVDTTAPVIVGTPRDSEVFASPTVCEAMVDWTAPTATDNCAPAPTPSYAVTVGGIPVSLVRGGDWPVGVYLVTYSATDANSNAATDTTFTVTVICPALFIRGDANGNGTINIGDPYWLLLYLFNVNNSNPVDLSCKDAADANDDEAINVSDAVFLYSALMGGGAPPSAPWPNCGEDPTDPAGTLDCDSYAGCP